SQFAGGKRLDLEFLVGRVRDKFREGLGTAVDRVEALREARGQAPLQFRRRLRNCGRRDRRSREAEGGGLEEQTSFHRRWFPSLAGRPAGVGGAYFLCAGYARGAPLAATIIGIPHAAAIDAAQIGDRNLRIYGSSGGITSVLVWSGKAGGEEGSAP